MPPLKGTPITPLQCLQRKVRTGERAISQAAVDRLQATIDEISDEYGSGFIGQEARVMQIALMRLENALKTKKRGVALQINAMKKAEERLALLKARAPNSPAADAFMTLLTPDRRALIRRQNPDGTMQVIAPENVQSLHDVYVRQGHALFAEGMAAFHSTRLGTKTATVLAKNFVDELYTPGSSGDKKAAALARIWKEKVDPFYWKKFQQAGGNLTPRNDWNMPRHYDVNKIIVAGRDRYVARMREFIDRGKMLDKETGNVISEEKLTRLIDESYESLITGGRSKDHAPRSSKLANRHTAERVFVFKSAEMERQFDLEFGSGGDLMGTLTGHMDRMSREIALMEMLGPNPDATMEVLYRQAMADNAKRIDTKASYWTKFQSPLDKTPMKGLENTYIELTGRTEIPNNVFVAQTLAGTKNFLSAVLLKGAWLSSWTDPILSRFAARFTGIDANSVTSRQMKLFLSGAFKDEGTEFATRLGLGAESWAAAAYGAHRYVGEYVGPKWTKLFSEASMRASFLTPWTQAGRHAFGMEMLGMIGKAFKEGRKLSDTHPHFQEMMRRYELTEAEWAALSKAPLDEAEGIPYASALSMSGVDPVAAMKIQRWMAEQVEYAVPSHDVRSSALLKQGTAAGSFAGTILRSTALFKMFPVLMYQTQLNRIMFDPMLGPPTSRLMYFARFAATMMLMGGTIFQAKRIAAGKEPVDPNDNWGAFLGAAALQSGALSIFGDLLFQDTTRYGQDFTSAVAGPVPSMVSDAFALTVGNMNQAIRGEDTNIGREAVKFARRYSPGTFYTQLAFERMLFDQMQKMMDVGARRSFQQREARERRDYNSQFWWGPGKANPFK